jgi:hypothetical protein
MARRPLFGASNSALFIAAVFQVFPENEALKIVHEAIEKGILGVSPSPVHPSPTLHHALQWPADEARKKMRFSISQNPQRERKLSFTLGPNFLNGWSRSGLY